MSVGFQPSASAARLATGRTNTVEHRTHPGGAQGVKISLEEVSRRVREGRNDPRVIGWAGRALIAAGKPKSMKAQAQAILDALRQKMMYVPDPIGTEKIAAAHVSLCLDEHGLCLPAADCDDLCVAMGSATLSVGIPTQVVGQAFGTDSATHVIVAIEDPKNGGWLRVDPSSDSYPVGKAFKATKEWWLDPMDPATNPGLPTDGSGDYVGVGTFPGRPYAFALGQGGSVLSDVYNAVFSQLQAAVFRVEQARNSLGAALQQVSTTKLAVNPTDPFDPEPSSPIKSVADFPGGGVWTQTMDAISTQLYDILDRLAQVGNSAIAGARQVIVDPNAQEAYIASQATDTWSLHSVLQTSEEVVLGFFDQAGTLLSGFGSKDGTVYSAAQIQQMASNKQQGTGGPEIIIGLVVVAVVGIATYFIVAKLGDVATAQAQEATNQSVMSCVTSGSCTQSQGAQMLDAIGKNRVAAAQAQAATDAANPFVQTTKNIEGTLAWIAVGGIAVAALIAIAPVIKAAADRHKALPAR